MLRQKMGKVYNYCVRCDCGEEIEMTTFKVLIKYFLAVQPMETPMGRVNNQFIPDGNYMILAGVCQSCGQEALEEFTLEQMKNLLLAMHEEAGKEGYRKEDICLDNEDVN